MKKIFTKRSAAILVASAATFLSVVGTTAGTLSWYAYSRRVNISFVGTSVKKSILLGIGLVDDGHAFSDADLLTYNFNRETCDTHTIVWTNSSTGIPIDAIKHFLDHSEFATNKLSPISTHARAIDSQADLTLYHAPDRGDTNATAHALTTEYVQLPFAFRVIGNDGQKVANQNIWLTETKVDASGPFIENAIRIFVENNQTKFLMSPADNGEEVRHTKVGGLLDLDGDGRYDYDLATHRELVYGEYTGQPTYSANKYGISYDQALPDNVNGTPYTDDLSTFYAKHDVDSYVANLSNVQFKTADYYPFGLVKPSISNVTGEYFAGPTGIPVANTSSGDYIGYSTFTIFLEGWDHAITDQAIGYSFNLGLQFEINRV